MGRRSDSAETKALKKKITQEFILAVDRGGKNMGPKDLEDAFGIGGEAGTGIVWCAYRRGARSMSFPSLRLKIQFAVNNDFITKPMGDSLLAMLPPSPELSFETSTPAGTPYTFDATLMFVNDVNRTVELLVKQIQALGDRISYGNEELEDIHYHATSLDILKPVQILIQDMLLEKQAEILRLKSKFGKDNYKDIAPQSPKNLSAWDVGYTPDWWMRPPPSAAEMVDKRNQVMNDKVKQQRAAFIARFGNDGVE